MKYLKNQRGFGLVGLMVAAAVIPPAVLISMRATDVVSKSARFFKSGQTRQSLNVVRDFLVMNAQNVDGDGNFELLKEEVGGGIPLSLPVNDADPYGTPYRYCTWDLDGQNIVNVGYSQNHTAPPAAGVIGRIISAGADKTFQTACDAATAAGDDMMVDIHESSVRFSSASIGGWADNGATVSLLNPSDYVGIGLNNPTHRLELVGGTSVAEGLAMGDVEIFRSGVDTLSLASGDSLNLVSGTLQVAGTTVIDSSRNVAAMNGTFSGGMLDLQNGTSNLINFRAVGVAPPVVGATSPGTKIILFNNGAGAGPHYSMGVDANTIWSAVPGTGQYFKWYGGTTLGMQLTGGGNLTVYGSTILGDAAADALTVRGLATFTDSSVTYPLRFGADVDLYRGAANRLDLASGDSLNLVGGTLQIAGVTVLDASRNLLNVTGVGTSLVPAVTDTYDLGIPGLQYRNLYSQNIYQNGSRVIDAASLSGSANYLSKFTGANAVGNSILQESGASILQYTGAVRGNYSVISDGDAQAYNEIMQKVQNTGGITAGKPLYWSWSLRKDGYFDGDSSGPGYSLYASRQGGGFYAPILFQADGDIILAGAQNAINGSVGIGTRAPAAQLHVLGTGADSSLTTHGEFVIGSITSANLSMDNNEIMARNNGAASALALNADGGDVLVGTNQAGKALFKVGSSSVGATTEIRINGPSGVTQRDLSFTTGDVGRWSIRADSTSESGANAGSDLQIIPRTDAGVALPTAMYIRRANGNVGIAGTPSSDASIKLAVSGDMQVNSRIYFAAALGGADSKAAIFGLNAGAGKRFHFFNYANSRDLLMIDGDTGAINVPSLGTSSVVFTDASKNLTTTGTVPVANGGTGLTSYAVGDILYASGATTLSRLAAAAAGNVLVSNGAGMAPSWGKVGLTTHVSGILPIANGGTGLSATPTNGQLLIGNGTGYTLAGLTGTANQVIVTNGAGSITLSLPQSIADTNSPTFAGLTINGNILASEYRLKVADGQGLRFWDDDKYKIWMSSTANGIWGGRLDTTSDYNMYFRMTGGTNRGFVFMSSTTPVAQITAAGDLLSKGSLIFKGVTSAIVGVGSTSNYGAMNILGAKGGYGGVNFRDVSGVTNYGTLMMSDTRSGFYNAADNGWRWYVTDAGLMYGPGGSHVKLGTGVQFPDGTVMTTSSDGTYAP